MQKERSPVQLVAMAPIYACSLEHYPILQIQRKVNVWEEVSVIYSTALQRRA